MCEHIIFNGGNKCINIDKDELKVAPSKTNDINNPDANNGLITSIWGPPTWESFHSITFGYPITPIDKQKKDYMEYFRLLGKVLPCIYCRQSYDKFITDVNQDTLLSIDKMESRETLTRWGLALHDAVNKKLGVEYGVTYEELCYKYEGYRAKCTKTGNGCKMPLSMKAMSYQKADIHRAPIVNIEYSRTMSNHAKKLGLKNYDEFLGFFSSIERNSKDWGARDCAARKIIRYMRKNGIDPLGDDGMPCVYELLLLSMLSSSLEIDKLDSICKKCTTI